jgi:hypothetical protein
MHLVLLRESPCPCLSQLAGIHPTAAVLILRPSSKVASCSGRRSSTPRLSSKAASSSDRLTPPHELLRPHVFLRASSKATSISTSVFLRESFSGRAPRQQTPLPPYVLLRASFYSCFSNQMEDARVCSSRGALFNYFF